MKPSSYSERDYAFGQAMLTLRTALGLTQAGLAQFLGVSRKAVGGWESGGSNPKAEHLKALLTLAVQQGIFPAGREAEEIRAFWKAAHQKVLLDESWLSALLNQPSPPPAPVPVEEAGGAAVGNALPAAPSSLTQAALPADSSLPAGRRAPAASGPRVDWGEALDVPSFYGREPELATLSRWVVEERCRLVSVLGMGGIGKSALVVRAMRRMAVHFEVVLFRSLRDAPDCSALLDDCLSVLSPKPLDIVPQSLERRLSLLLEDLRSRRVLLVLDNLEVLLEAGEVRGHLRPGFEAYGHLLRQVAQTGHQSCLLLTSREKPAALRSLEGSRTPVRSLPLLGLEAAACAQLLAEHEVIGSPDERARLGTVYAGNPLALNIVAETIADLFGGQIDPFLAGGTPIFGSITELLDEQWARLSPLEQMVLSWLAILREPVTLDDLRAVQVGPLAHVHLLEAVDGLRRRCLIERGQRAGSFTLQSVVLEYVTSRLVTTASLEIQQGRLLRLREHGLSQAGARDYVRQTQERLLLAPLLARLESMSQGRAEVEGQLRALLEGLREWPEEAQGYGPANLVALLRLLRGDLRGLDLSQLALRGASLQGVEMQDARLSGALLRECVLTETFDAITSVAISRSGEYWAAASERGEVRVWREAGQTLHLAWQAHTDIVTSIAFSPDERTLASGSLDNSVKLWEVESCALLWSGWQTKGPACLAFAPAGDLLASGDFAGKIWLWERQPTGSARCVQALEGHSNLVRGLAFAPDGSRLASASWDGSVKLWEVGETGSHGVRQTLLGHTEGVHCVAWSPDGGTLASCGLDHTIRLWDVEEGRYRTALQGHSAGVNGLAFTPDSSSLLSGSSDGTMRLWDVTSGQCLRVMQGYTASLYDVDWSPDGTWLASAGSDTVVSIWEVASATLQRVLRGHGLTLCSVAWSPDGSLLASSGWDGAIRLWDPTIGTSVQILRDPDHPDTAFFGMAWSPDGQLLACGTYQRGLQVWDVTTRSLRWADRAHVTWIRRVAWSPDGTRLVGGDDDGHVSVWDARGGTKLLRLAGHHGAVTSVAWSPDGTHLASGGGSQRQGAAGELFVWDAHNGQRHPAWHPLRGRGNAGNSPLAGYSGVVSALSWVPSGELLVSGGSDGMLRWWDLQSGECMRVREAHQGTVQALKLSPDGHRLASCGDDGTIRLWDLERGEHLRTLRRDRPYERLNITGIRGLTEAQKATLRGLGAMEDEA